MDWCINKHSYKPPTIAWSYYYSIIIQLCHNVLFVFQKAKYFEKLAQDYQKGIDDVLWNEKEGTWLDYDNKNAKPRNYFYPSNLTPLYTKSFNLTAAAFYGKATVDYLKRNEIGEYMGKWWSSLNLEKKCNCRVKVHYRSFDLMESNVKVLNRS